MRVRHLGLVDYQGTADAMQAWTQARQAGCEDELWLCEHPSVFTLGTAADAAHVLDGGDIPVVRTTRGGQVTYHGPGQVVAYPLVDLRRLGLFVKDYVSRLEEAAIRTLAGFGIAAQRVAGAPGVYVALDAARAAHATHDAAAQNPFAGLGKIAALGIKIRNGCAYHGLALNVAMDLQPYARINPCGYQQLAVCDMRMLGCEADSATVAQQLAAQLQALLQPAETSDNPLLHIKEN